MMRKRFLSLTCALVLCLGLLPVTALAVGEPATLYVGNTQVISGTETTYWKTNDSGELEKVEGATDTSKNWNVKYDPNSATLTLRNATIKTTNTSGNKAVIYAQSNSQSAVSLTIELDGRNTIECASALFGIYVNAEMSDDSYGTNASLTITGNGSLEVSGSSYGIWVKSGTGNASLNINDASVVAKTTQTHSGYAGVYVQSSAQATSSPQLSLAVNGGSLTTSASEGNDGIQFYVGSSKATDATTSLTVSDNAIVDARTGGISASGVSGKPNVTIGSTGSTGGIVFDGTEGTVYGNVTLKEDLTVGEDESLTVPEGSSLNCNGKLTNNGTILASGGTVTGSLSGGSTTVTTPSISQQPTGQTVTEGQGATFTVEASAGSETLTYQWQQSTDSGSSWTAINDATGDSYTISSTTSSMNNYQYRCVVKSASGVSVISQTATLTVQAKPASVPVTGVTLEPKELSLYTGQSETLAATVQPEDATNQSVTWKSSDDTIATVDSTGKVTAVGAGNATITVTTEDGEKTATCSVTVTRPYIPPANPNYKITVAATQGGTVTADPAAAKAGTTVTLTPVPHRGYQVGSVAVTDRFGEPVAVTEQADGTYTFTMPSGQVKVEVTFVESQPEPLPFTDVAEGDWFHDAVRYVYDNGLMDGVGDGQFAPNATTNRAMVVTILYRLAGEPDVSGDLGFTDVEPGLWYSNAVAWAAQKGIVNGISETEFSPSGDLTREQLAAILYRYAACQGYDVSQRADLSGFGDAESISGYAQEALSWAHAQGLVLGFEDGSLRPQGNASRAQIAAVLMRFLAAVPTA